MNVATKDIDGYITTQDENVQAGLYKLRGNNKVHRPGCGGSNQLWDAGI